MTAHLQDPRVGRPLGRGRFAGFVQDHTFPAFWPVMGRTAEHTEYTR